jgi:S1-C subfamily serine protease
MALERLSRRSFLGALGVSAAGVAAGCQSSGETNDTATDSSATQGVATGQAATGSEYTQVYNEVADAVASIRVYYDYGGASQGSGFLIDDTHLVTNEHVVAEADSFYVRFTDTDWRELSVVGTDVYSDLAVLEVDSPPTDATSLSLTSTTPDIGTRVVAIGNPFGLSGSVSEGIVSGVNRTLQGANNFSIAAGIQTDAAVNPGNSGGPLVDLDGNVMGVINSGGGDNVGFAISSELALRVVPALIEDGSYDHPYMGVTLQSVSPLLAEGNDLDDAAGVYINSTLSGGPADGVLEGSTGTTVVEGVEVNTGGDVVRRLDDTEIATRGDLATYLALETSPGDTMAVTVQRNGAMETVDLTLGTRPDPRR